MGGGWFESLVLYINVQLCQCGCASMSLCLGDMGRTDGRMYRSLSLKDNELSSRDLESGQMLVLCEARITYTFTHTHTNTHAEEYIKRSREKQGM